MTSKKSMYKIVYIEPTTQCQVKCAVCPVYKPVGEKIPFCEMTIEVANNVAKYCGYTLKSKVATFGNWCEPFLNKNMLDIVKLFKVRGMETIVINSNFSVNLDIEKMIQENYISRINVSISGLTNNVYNVYHRLGDINLILKNIDKALEYKQKYNSKTNIVVKWHRFKHNENQLAEAAKYFLERDVKFMPYYAHMGCVENISEYMTDRINMEKGKNKFITNRVHVDYLNRKCKMYSSEPKRCHQQDFVTIHADGHILFCCAYYSSHLYKSEKPIFEMTKQEVRKFKNTPLDFCKECFKLGIATYFHKPKI